MTDPQDDLAATSADVSPAGQQFPRNQGSFFNQRWRVTGDAAFLPALDPPVAAQKIPVQDHQADF